MSSGSEVERQQSALVLNPFSPLAFLPPDEARQVQLATWVLVASLAIFVWDFLGSLKADLRMLGRDHRSRFRFTVVYYISRLTSLAYLLAFTILFTAPVGHCTTLLPRISILYFIAVPSTTLLLLIRVCSLYSWNKPITTLFSLLWLAVVGSSVVPIPGMSALFIGTTDYCMVSRLESYISLSPIISFVYDVLVFGASGWWLLTRVEDKPAGKKDVTKLTRFERYQSAFSRAVFEGGQMYYLSAVFVNLVTAILSLTHTIPLPYRFFIHIPNLVVMNSMASHVFRQVKFGVYIGGDSDPLTRFNSRDSMTTIVFARMPPPRSTAMSRSVQFRSQGTFVELPGLGSGEGDIDPDVGHGDSGMV